MSGDARDVHVAVVGPGELGDHCEADAAARHLGRVAAPPETLGDVRQVLQRDADARVSDGQRGMSVILADLHGDVPAGRGELDGVAEQIGDDLMHPPVVGQDRSRSQDRIQRDRGDLEPRFHAVRRGMRHVGQIPRLGM